MRRGLGTGTGVAPRLWETGSTGPSSIVRVGTWHTMWARPTSRRGRRIRAALQTPDCDVLCVAEGFAGIFPDTGHVTKAPKNWGNSIKDDRRKVLLWSKRLGDIDTVGSEGMPGGRFIRAATRTAAGTVLTVVGVCIPWRGANCTSGRKDRKPWQDHRTWLAEFDGLRSRLPATRLVVLGDFNQQIPRHWAPRPDSVGEALLQAFEGLEIATKGDLEGAPRPSIDHIAHSPDLVPESVAVWSDRHTDGAFLSDHLGVRGDLRLR